MNPAKAKLYLIPTTLGEVDPLHCLPESVFSQINHIDHYLVENEKSARQALKKMGIKKPLPEIKLYLLDKNTKATQLKSLMQALADGHDMGVLSEAGCPGIADPGALAVEWAHAQGFQVVPMVGPSSILLALMASGFSGQKFAFHGYLPIDRNERIRSIKELEKMSAQLHQTQLFIETPYRNNHLLEDLLKQCQPSTRLAVAADITLPTEFIRSQTIAAWRKSVPDLHKRPALFLLFKD